MSAVDASVTTLVTLVSMFFMIDWRLTHLPFCPLPVMVVVVDFRHCRKPQSLQRGPRRLLELNNFVQESVSGVMTKSFGFQADVRFVLLKPIRWSFRRRRLQPVTMLCLIRPLFFCRSLLCLTLYFGVYLIQKGAWRLANVTFITHLNMSFWPLQAMGFLFNISQRASVSYDRIETLSRNTRYPRSKSTSHKHSKWRSGIWHWRIAYEKEPGFLEKVVFHLWKRANPWN